MTDITPHNARLAALREAQEETERVLELLDANLDTPSRIRADGWNKKAMELSARLREVEAENAKLRAACDEAHQLLWHYDLTPRPYGVDWGPVEMLRTEMVHKLGVALGVAFEGARG